MRKCNITIMVRIFPFTLKSPFTLRHSIAIFVLIYSEQYLYAHPGNDLHITRQNY